MFYVLLGISTLVGIIIAFVMKLYHKYGFFLIGLVVGIELGSVLWTLILERFLPDVIFTFWLFIWIECLYGLRSLDWSWHFARINSSEMEEVDFDHWNIIDWSKFNHIRNWDHSFCWRGREYANGYPVLEQQLIWHDLCQILDLLSSEFGSDPSRNMLLKEAL